MKISRGEKIFRLINYIFLALLGAGSVIPFMFVISVSITPLSEVMRHGGFMLFPTDITFTAYTEVFTKSTIPRALSNTLFVTSAGTFLSLIFSAVMGFGLAKKGVPGRKIYLFFVVFTMLFSGGIIPTYLVVKSLGLLNTLWAIILPIMITPFNLLIVKTFFEHLPDELEDAATIDGCSDLGVLARIVIPLSVPVLVTIGLFYAVNYWNVYFPGILYITDTQLYPLQVALQQMLVSPDMSDMFMDDIPVPSQTLKMAAVVVSSLPIIIVYPFLQKYFVKGATLGAIKG